MIPKAVIFGCTGPVLTPWEQGFFAEADPVGFILFARNCRQPDQVRDLVGALRASVGRDDAPVLIDQEGGRVARLKPPHWRAAPPAARFGALAANDMEAAREAVYVNARLLAAELAALGVSVDCTPVLDLPAPGAHGVIGDRAYGRDPALVAALGRAVCEGLLDGGVLPVVKHIPGHGRATRDSHHELPTVTTARETLETTDFAPFRALADVPWAMTGHVVYSAIDPDHPATTSRRIVAEVIRGFIGFDGVLVSDDISMQALAGPVGARAEAAVEAGCDLVLHCNGKGDEMRDVARAVPPLSPAARRRMHAAAARPAVPSPPDIAGMRTHLDSLLGAA